MKTIATVLMYACVLAFVCGCAGDDAGKGLAAFFNIFPVFKITIEDKNSALAEIMALKDEKELLDHMELHMKALKDSLKAKDEHEFSSEINKFFAFMDGIDKCDSKEWTSDDKDKLEKKCSASVETGHRPFIHKRIHDLPGIAATALRSPMFSRIF